MPADEVTPQQIAELTNHATQLRRSGRSAEAAEAYAEATRLADEHGDHTMRAIVRVNAGTAYGDIGDRVAEMRAYVEAIELIGTDADLSTTLLIAKVNLGGAYFANDQLDDAERLILEAYELAVETDERSQQGVAIGHLGLIAMQRGQLASGLDLLETAVAIAGEESDLWNLQHFQRDLANAYSQLGLTADALAAYALAGQLSVAANDVRSQAQCLHGIGMNELRSRDPEALQTLNEAYSLFVEIGDRRSAFDAALTLTGAWVARAAGLDAVEEEYIETGALPTGIALRDPTSLNTAKQWIKRAEGIAGEIGADSSDLALARHNFLRLDGDLVGAAATLEGALITGHDAFGQERLHTTLGLLLHSGLDRPGEALRHFDEALRLRESLTTHLGRDSLRAHIRNSAAPLFAMAAAAAVDANAVEKAFGYSQRLRLAEARQVWEGQDQSRATLHTASDVARSLANLDATALVEFLIGPNSTIIFVFVSGEAAPQVLDVPFGIGALGRDWWIVLSESRRMALEVHDLDAWQGQVSETCAILGERLMRPIEQALSAHEVEHVVLVPHALLHNFPLHAATMESGETWLDKYVVSYAPSSSVAVEQWNEKPAIPQSICAVGDPGGDLPLASVEASRVHARVQPLGKLLLGAQANRGALLDAFSDCEWLHFAGHALQVLDDPGGTGLVLASSGDDEDDAFLDSLTLARSGFPGGSVILSACESGAVTPYLADELSSLAGSFIVAGADAVVATYWRVDDVCAALIMERFYDGLATGSVSLAEALRGAQLEVREMGEDEVFDWLERVLSETQLDAEAAKTLDSYSRRRDSVRPFSHPEAWAAYYVMGDGMAPTVRSAA